jgi:hypothetical protein
MELAAWPVLLKGDTGHLLFCDELQNRVRRVSEEITQVDEIKQVADFIRLQFVLWPSHHRSHQKLAIAKVFRK